MSLLLKPLFIGFYLLAAESIPTAKLLSKKKSTGFIIPPMARMSLVPSQHWLLTVLVPNYPQRICT